MNHVTPALTSLPPAQQAVAKGSVAGASSVASGLPRQDGVALEAAASESFAHGARNAYEACAVVLLLGALFVLVIARAKSDADQPDRQPGRRRRKHDSRHVGPCLCTPSRPIRHRNPPTAFHMGRPHVVTSGVVTFLRIGSYRASITTAGRSRSRFHVA